MPDMPPSPANALMSMPGQPTQSPGQLLGQQQPSNPSPSGNNPLQSMAPGQQLQPPGTPPKSVVPPSLAQVKTSIDTNRLILKELTGIAQDPQVMADPDKLQKALLSLTADSHRAAGKDAPPVASSLAHTMDIMSDPRGPQAAIRDRIATVLGKLSQLDSYARQKHGTSPLAQTPTPAPSLNATSPTG